MVETEQIELGSLLSLIESSQKGEIDDSELKARLALIKDQALDVYLYPKFRIYSLICAIATLIFLLPTKKFGIEPNFGLDFSHYILIGLLLIVIDLLIILRTADLKGRNKYALPAIKNLALSTSSIDGDVEAFELAQLIVKTAKSIKRKENRRQLSMISAKKQMMTKTTKPLLFLMKLLKQIKKYFALGNNPKFSRPHVHVPMCPGVSTPGVEDSRQLSSFPFFSD